MSNIRRESLSKTGFRIMLFLVIRFKRTADLRYCMTVQKTLKKTKKTGVLGDERMMGLLYPVRLSQVRKAIKSSPFFKILKNTAEKWFPR